jgi:hypothetical protein
VGSHSIGPTTEMECRLIAERREAALARKSTSENGRSSLEAAMAMLIQNQATFVGQLSEIERRHLEYQRETAERFARLEAQMAEVIRVLNEHNRVLERLTEAVHEKIGFKG